MPGSSHGGGRRRKRVLCAQEKYQVGLQLVSGELSQREAAERWGVDPTTILRIGKVAKESALQGLAVSKPGARGQAEGGELAAARAEIARLEETVKEQAIGLVALRGKQHGAW